MRVRQRPGVMSPAGRWAGRWWSTARTSDEGGVHRVRTARAALSRRGIEQRPDGAVRLPRRSSRHITRRRTIVKKFLILFVVALVGDQRGSDGGARKAGQEHRRDRHLRACCRTRSRRSAGRRRTARLRDRIQEGRRLVRRSRTPDGDAQKQKTQADQCLANGAKVVILVSLDAGSSIAIEKVAATAGGEGRSTTTARSRAAPRRSTSRSTAAGSVSCRARASSPG